MSNAMQTRSRSHAVGTARHEPCRSVGELASEFDVSSSKVVAVLRAAGVTPHVIVNPSGHRNKLTYYPATAARRAMLASALEKKP